MVADALSRVWGFEMLSSLLLCSSTSKLGVSHVDDGCADVDADLACSGVLSVYENDSFL